MPRPYFTLVTNEDNAGWAPQFGDYDRETVEYEQEDYCDGGIPKRYTKILRTSDAKQSTINAAIAKLNAR